MAKQDESRKKGTFSNIRLAISKKYIYPLSRKRMMQVGGIGCLVLLVYFIFDLLFANQTFLSQGPVSVNHANFESECSRCHQSFETVNNTKCSVCHEKANDKLGTYTFAAHYVYTSADLRRVNTSQEHNAAKEISCATCHPEHRGRDAEITEVPDMRCISCHEYGSFNKNHPEFEFVRNRISDDATLRFTHIKHVKEVLKKIGSVNVETSCFYCHKPEGEGRHFMPINFDVHCAECHQPVGNETPALSIHDPNNPTLPGVETLQMIQSRRRPGTLWAFYTNPNEFTVKANDKIVKSPVYHKDPWVLENLKLIRQILYSDVGLTDLLKTLGSVPNNKTDILYREALQTLQDYANGLRGRPEPEVQADLAYIDKLLNIVQMNIGRYPINSFDSFFSFKRMIENPDLTEGQKKDLEDFSLKVAKPCLECHVVEHAAIARVNAEQRVLHRAVFNHRAHILQRRCLECHVEIPINQVILDKDTTQALLLKDRSEIQNIPKVENCYQCHTPKEASNKCVTCHYMHPNKEQRANLQLFVEKK